MRKIGFLIVLFLLSGCEYSVKAIHGPSVKSALDMVDTDCTTAYTELNERFDDLYDQLEPWIPAMVAEARKTDPEVTTVETVTQFRAHQEEFHKATLPLLRAAERANAVKGNLGLDKEPTGNVGLAGAAVAGGLAGAAIASAF